MWDKILGLVAQYGPFPFGVVVGIIIKSWSVDQFLKSAEKEKDALRKEKRELIDLVKVKEDRIDKLHGKLSSKKKELSQ
ncbi:MAG: hypothetical protein PHI06_08830 [Desulfobulbaceae bacterium]|nr:hypothetical protein [Desulfobulbaceae bacterium]